MKKTAIIESIYYDLGNGIAISLKGWNYTQFIKPEELHRGGQNGEINTLVVGGKISFDYDTVNSVRNLKNVTIISDGIREVDENGKLIKW